MTNQPSKGAARRAASKKTIPQILSAAGFSDVQETLPGRYLARGTADFNKAHAAALQNLCTTTDCRRQNDGVGPYLVVTDTPVPPMSEPVTETAEETATDE